MLKLSWKNFKQHFSDYLPAILVLAMGISLINMVFYLKGQIDKNFNTNMAGIDAVVGAKGSGTQIVMANIYHTDFPTGNIPLKDALKYSNKGIVKQAYPLAYGDNHKGFRLLGTTTQYIQHFNGKIISGKYSKKPLEVVVGFHAAEKLGITVGYTFHSTHGHSHGGHHHHTGPEHEDTDYKVVGILGKTGTVIDNLLITPIASVWKTHGEENLENSFDSASFELAQELNSKIEHSHEHDHHHEHHEHSHHEHEHHDDHDHNSEHAHHDHDEEIHEEHDHPNHPHDHEDEHVEITAIEDTSLINADTPANELIEDEENRQITGLLLCYHGSQGFLLNGQMNMSPNLTAVNPGQVINKLFDQLQLGLDILNFVGYSVLFISILTLSLTLLRLFKSRKYELSLLRVFGASKLSLSSLLLLENLWINIVGFSVGWLFTFLFKILVTDSVDTKYNYSISSELIGFNEVIILMICFICGMVSAIIPLIKSYNIDISKTLADEK